MALVVAKQIGRGSTLCTGQRLVLKCSFSSSALETKKKPSVGVVGQGIAALSLALTLQRHGINATLLPDAANHPPKRTGLMLPVNAMVLLKHLGIAEPVERAGTVLSSHLVTRFGSRPYGQLDLKALGTKFGASAVGIERQALLRAMESQLTVKPIRKGIYGFQQPAGSDVVRCEIFDSHGSRRNVDFDLMVIADGTKSKVRHGVFGIDARPGNFVYYDAFIQRPPTVDGTTMTDIWGIDARMYMVPCGRDGLYVWGSVSGGAATASSGQARVRDFVKLMRDANFNKLGVPDVLDAILKLPEVGLSLTDMVPSGQNRMYNRRFALIGDAAHAFPPGIHQGAAMAIEDAFVLGELVANFPDDIPKALEMFDKARRGALSNIEKIAIRDGTAAHFMSGRFSMWAREMTMRWTHSGRGLRSRYGKMAEDAVKIRDINASWLSTQLAALPTPSPAASNVKPVESSSS
eukprot:TRINITY_DN27087_c0_g1_i1.p1 TRINITY_DN27087_c0_g1~~TRINITY_DN27087_c0_g1_i1.p1  ORF type:complete len:463 (+),score=142.42 TRINITY_DN27087_c0_g1_i1:849-2237(+)